MGGEERKNTMPRGKKKTEVMAENGRQKDASKSGKAIA